MYTISKAFKRIVQAFKFFIQGGFKLKNQPLKSNELPKSLLLLLAFACGLIVANLYYAQPLVLPISQATHLSSSAAGLIVTMTQIGYVIGLLFLVPLSDLKENVRLIVIVLSITIIGLLLSSFTKSSVLFLCSAFLTGLGAVTAQILVPYASHLASAERRGEVVGTVMSGLLFGIMLARPASSFVASLFGWQFIFKISALLMLLLILLLVKFMPKRIPHSELVYSKMIISLWHIFKTTPLLRRRAYYQASLFGCFSLFWTVVPIYLMSHFHITQQGVAMFAFVGVAGASVAPLMGKLADKGYSRTLTGIAFILASASFCLTHLLQNRLVPSFFLFLIAAILLDMAVSGNLILGQQAIYTLGDDIRGRVNGIFMAIFFLGGALGSSIGGLIYAKKGWMSVSLIGIIIPLLAFAYYLTEYMKKDKISK